MSKPVRVDAIESDRAPSANTARPLEILLLCDWRDDIASTVSEHIEALCGLSRHWVRRVSMLGDLPPSLDLARFDALIIHYSLDATDRRYISAEASKAIAAFDGLKVQFIQDEYRHVNRTVEALRKHGIHLLFTCVSQAEVEKVYPTPCLPDITKVTVLTGYVTGSLLKLSVPPLCERSLDVGYRARDINPWLGELGQEKSRIARRFEADAARFGLCCDISCREEDRIYGENWVKFLTSCRAVLGTESGASVFDGDGSVQRAVEKHLRRHPGATFETLQETYFGHLEGKIRLNQISPRCFEAAALRTLMILYPGEYSGILEPGRHYVVLEKDHSNIAEVAAIIRDVNRAQRIVDCAYAEVAADARWSWRSHVEMVDAAISTRIEEHMRSILPSYSQSQFQWAARLGLRGRLARARRHLIDWGFRIVFGALLSPLPVAARERTRAGLRRFIRSLRAHI